MNFSRPSTVTAILLGVFLIVLCIPRENPQSPPSEKPNPGIGNRLESGSPNNLHDPSQVGQLQNSPLEAFNRGASAFDAPVRFWGQVVDQDWKPLSGVTIAGDVNTLRFIKTPTGYREFSTIETKSDGEGRFMLEGAAGFTLTISKLNLEGYVLPSAYQAGMRWPEEYARYAYRYATMDGQRVLFHPTPNRPVVFHLWKLRNPQPVIIYGNLKVQLDMFQIPEQPLRHISVHHHPLYDAQKDGLKGDISLSLAKSHEGATKTWRLTIQAVEPDAGVQKAPDSDPFLFDAPDSGYTRSIDYVLDEAIADDSKGHAGVPVRFFIRCKGGGWHAAVDARFFTPDASGQAVAQWRHWLNPTGSRHLEHDGSNPIAKRPPPPPQPAPAR